MVYSATPVRTGIRPLTTRTHRLENRELLGIFERRVLAHAAEQNDAVNSGPDHGVEMFRGRLQIQTTGPA